MGNILQPVLDKYLKDYFENFSLSNMDIGLSTFGLNNLIFSQKILDGVAMPIRLKFGMLGNMTIHIPSYFNLGTEGVRIKISNVFICLEMRDVNKWNEKLVTDKYQESKRASLKTLQNNTDIVYARYQKDEESSFSPEFLQKIAANTSIEIENVYLMYEDESFEFQIGLLLPNIQVQSMNNLWEVIENNIEDTSVLFKKLTVSNVSFFVNHHRNFQSINSILEKANIQHKSFDQQSLWTRDDCTEVGKIVNKYLKDTFEDSNKRFTEIKDTKNYYVFLERLSIELRVQVTLNKTLAKQLNHKFDDPDLVLHLVLGSLDQKDGYLSINLEEEQIQALLHIGTFFNAFSNYSQGVLRSKFHSSASKELKPEDRQKYQDFFIQFLDAKCKPKTTEKELKEFEEQLWKYEEPYRTDILLRLRQAVIEQYFESLIIKEKTKKDIKNLEPDQSMFAWNKKNTKLNEQRKDVLEKNEQSLLEEQYRKMQKRLDEVDALVKKQKDGDHVHKQEDEIDEIKDESTKVGKKYEINFLMPKLTLTLHQSVKEKLGMVTSRHHLYPMCVLLLEGIRLKVIIGTMPETTHLFFGLRSLEVQDHRVREAVKKKNPKMDDHKQVSSNVLQTWVKNEHHSDLITVALSIMEEEHKKPEMPIQLDVENNRQDLLDVVDKEMTTTIEINVTQELLIYLNIFFINNLIQLTTRIFEDMNLKRDKLLQQASGSEVKRQIQDGFKVLTKIRNFAEVATKKLQQQKLQQSANSSMNLVLNMASPKLIIDEYLLAEEVQDIRKPCYFLVDMGSWQVKNNITRSNIEIEPHPSVYQQAESEPRFVTEKKDLLYESWDMTICDIKILYNYHNYESLLKENSDLNFKVFDKFTFGFQFQSLVSDVDDPDLTIPRSQINLKFQKLRLYYERSVFRQLLKVKTFITEGSFMDNIKDLVEVLANSGPNDEADSQGSDDSRASQLIIEEPSVNQVPKEMVNSIQRRPLTADQIQAIQDANFQIENAPKNLSNQSSMRVNLLFLGVEIRAQEAVWTRKREFKVSVTTVDLLSIESKDFKIIIHMSDIDQKMSVLVLLSKLSIKDLRNPDYFFKNMVRSTKQSKQQQRDGGATGTDFLAQSMPQAMSLMKQFSAVRAQSNQRPTIKKPENKKVRMFKSISSLIGKRLSEHQEIFDFTDFQRLYAKDEFLSNQHQVSVYFGKSVIEPDNEKTEIKKQISYSSTIIKIQHVHFIAHFKLIAGVMQTVFDVLYDLSDVEEEYKKHISKGKRMAQTFIATAGLGLLMGDLMGGGALEPPKEKEPSIEEKDDELADDLAGLIKWNILTKGKQHQKYVFENSSLAFMMPKIKLIIPTNLEQEHCLSLKLGADFSFTKDSKEQHFVNYSEKKVDDNENGKIEETELDNILLDSKSDMVVKLNSLKMYISQTKQENQCIFRPRKHKTTSDYILSPLNFNFITKETSYANHKHDLPANHSVTLLQNMSYKRDRERRNKVKNSFIANAEVDRITIGSSFIECENPFNLQFRIKQMRMYMEIVQLIIYHQRQITMVEAKKFVEAYKEEMSRKPTMTFTSQRLQQAKNDILIMQRVGQMIMPKKETQEEPALDKSPSDDERDIFGGVQEEIQEDQQEPNQSIEELINQNAIKGYQKLSKLLGRIIGDQKPAKHFEILHDKMQILTCGMNICLLDDITSQFEEPLIQIAFTNLDLDQTSLNSNDAAKLNIVEADAAFTTICSVMRESGLSKNPELEMFLLKRKIDLWIKASYFNHKSFGEEMLIELYKIELNMRQLNPTKPMITEILSKDMFNLNLTYGCILSVYKVLQFIKDDEKVDEKIEQDRDNKGRGMLLEPRRLVDPDMLNQMIQAEDGADGQDGQDAVERSSSHYDGSVSGESQVQLPQINIEEEDVDAIPEETKEVKKLQLPVFKFHNKTGKTIVFNIVNESHTQGDQQEEEGKKFQIEQDNSKPENFQKSIESHVKDLLASYNNSSDEKETKNARLYMNFTIDGYQTIEHISLNSIGIFGYIITRLVKKLKPHDCVIRILRNRGETLVYFESNSVLQNNMTRTIKLIAFEQIGREFKVVQEVGIPANEVYVLPLKWFEMNLQVIVDLPQNKHTGGFPASQYIFRHGKICEVLNPKIIQPYHVSSAQIKLGDVWVALELALLTTRTKVPQFLIMLHTLTKVHNLMFYPLEIYAGVNQDKVEKHSLQTNESHSIDELNLTSNNARDSQFYLKIETDDCIAYENRVVNWYQSQQDTKHTKVTKGHLIKLELMKHSHIGRQQEFADTKGVESLQQSITCVMEKVSAQELLIDSTKYGSFSLRQTIFHHSARQRYEIYTPFVAVNETQHEISLCNVQSKMLNLLKPRKNLLVDFTNLLECKMRVKVKGFNFSEKIDLSTVGVHGRVVLQQNPDDTGVVSIIQNDDLVKEGESEVNKKHLGQKKFKETVELGTSIKLCDSPYAKTKVIRFTNRFTLINKMSYPIVVRCIASDNQYIFAARSSGILDFASENKNKELQVRMCQEEEVKNLKVYGNKRLPYRLCHFVQQSQWSKKFSGSNMDDFQIYMPYNTPSSKKDAPDSPDAISRNQIERKNSIVAGSARAVNGKTQWDKDDLWGRHIIKITITSDPEFTEKIYCIVSRPLQPDFLLLNYLSCPLRVTDSRKHSNREIQAENNIVEIPKGSNNMPSAAPVVISPYNIMKKLSILVNNQDTIKYKIDGPNIPAEIENYNSASKGRITVQCSSRVSGTIRIIEIKHPSKDQQKIVDETKLNREERKQELIKQVRQVVIEKEGDDDSQNSIFINQQQYELDLAGIGLSFVDFKPHELCYITLDKINCTRNSLHTKRGLLELSYEDINLTIRNFQIDAMQNEVFPVLLGPKTPFRNIEREFQQKKSQVDDSISLNLDGIRLGDPLLSLSILKNSEIDGELNTDTIESFQFALAPIEFKLHISLVMEIQELLSSLQSLTSNLEYIQKSALFKSVNETQLIMSGESAKVIDQDSRNDLNKVYRSQVESQQFKHLEVNPVLIAEQKSLMVYDQHKKDSARIKEDSKIEVEEVQSQSMVKEDVVPEIRVEYSQQINNLSVKKVKKIFMENFKIKAIRCFMTLRIRGIESILQKRGPIGWLLNLSSNLADITDAEFNFTEMEVSKKQMSEQVITTNLTNHYKNEALLQLYQVLGSQDIIGNPSSFIANVSKGTESFYSEPLEGLVDRNYGRAAVGVVNSLKGIVSNTGIAVTNSYTGISGSVYLGLKNVCGSNLTHADLDRPLTIGGGIQKGVIGFVKESYKGFIGMYYVPAIKIQTQGKGVPQIMKGVGQGLLQFTLSPVSASLRASYDLSTGIKQQLKGVKDHGQRFRYPRYFDQNNRMPPYNQDFAHAHIALINVAHGKHRQEIIQKVYDVSTYTGKGRFQGFFKDRVIIITNLNILYIYSTRKLASCVPLHKIKGMMFYFQNKKYNSIIVEQIDGSIVSMRTDLPEINKHIVTDLKMTLEQMEKQQQNQKNYNKAQVQLAVRSMTRNLMGAGLVEKLDERHSVAEERAGLDDKSEGGVSAGNHGEIDFEKSQGSEGDQNQEWTLTWETIENIQ